jgi:hypothetical protein
VVAKSRSKISITSVNQRRSSGPALVCCSAGSHLYRRAARENERKRDPMRGRRSHDARVPGLHEGNSELGQLLTPGFIGQARRARDH